MAQLGAFLHRIAGGTRSQKCDNTPYVYRAHAQCLQSFTCCIC